MAECMAFDLNLNAENNLLNLDEMQYMYLYIMIQYKYFIISKLCFQRDYVILFALFQVRTDVFICQNKKFTLYFINSVLDIIIVMSLFSSL